MGMYDFQCKKCNHVFEELIEFVDIPKVRCQKCNSKRVTKLLNGALGLGLNTSFDFRAKKNFEKAQIESFTAKAKFGGRSPYKHMDDTQGGNRMNFTD